MIIWLASYPKSGNTWVRAILSQILLTGPSKENEVLENLKNISSYPKRKHFLNLSDKFIEEEDFEDKEKVIKNWIKSQDKINSEKQIKIFKTHNYLCKLSLKNKDSYSFTNLENTLGVIYIVRDPRNVITSLKYHYSLNNYKEAFEMMENRKMWIGIKEKTIPEAISSWDDHYESWSRFKNNFLLIKYEDLLEKPEKVINDILKYIKNFIKINLSESDVKKIISNTTFENMKNQENRSGFGESVRDKNTKERKKFFNLGPKNNWKELLDQDIAKLVENRFSATMKKLNYVD
tara:strand:+ start:26 stop:898 length:873 start_codon:yes stop_codon:yes gene_type:complete